MDFPMEHHGTNVVNHLRDVWLASSLLLPPRLPYSHDPDGKTDGIIGWKCPMVTLRIKPFCEGSGLWAGILYLYSTWFQRKLTHFESSAGWKSGSIPHSYVCLAQMLGEFVIHPDTLQQYLSISESSKWKWIFLSPFGILKCRLSFRSRNKS